MDPCQGMEVGAEVELNEGTSTLEDHTPIRLENKQDLPLWQNIHYFDDSSSDESLDQKYGNSTPSAAKTLGTASRDTKSQVMVNYNLEKNIIVLYTTDNIQSGHSHVLDSAYSKDLQEPASQLAPYFEEPGISCTEVNSSSDIGHLHPYSTETTLSNEENPRESLGKYSNAVAKTLCDRSVKSFLRSYKCQRCGREFGRLYNLEHHRCIDMAIGCPQQYGNTIETMNRLEKMCVEAQKELQSLQGQYKKEVIDLDSSQIQMWSQELLSGSGRVNPENECTAPCDHNECESSSICVQEFPVSSDNNGKMFASQNLTALGDNIVVNLSNCSPILLEANKEQDLARQMEGIHPQLDQINGELTNLNQHLSLQTIGENQVDVTNTSHDATKMYKCHECGKVYKTHCSFTNHMHWHTQNFKSFVLNTLLETSPGSHESYGITHHVGTPPLDLKNVNCAKTTQTFTCEYCGKVFNKRCSYATHTLWHLKKMGHVTNTPTKGAKQETGQVSSLQNSDRACSSPVNIFTCQSCGRVFNKRCAYSSHSRWHMREQEMQKRVIDEKSSLRLREQVAKKSEEPTYSSLPMQVETNRQKLPEVLESVLELVVGSEEVHEILLSKAGLMFRKAENYGNAAEVAEELAQVSEIKSELAEEQDPGTQLKPEEKQVPAMQSEPAGKPIPGTNLEPEKKQVPEKRSEPAKKQVPAKKEYSLKISQSKFAAQCLRRTKPRHRCRDCGVRFQQLWRLRQHRLKGFGKTLKKHRCDCGRTPIGSLHFLLHQLQHLSDTSFACAVCNKSLRGYRRLQAHSRVHPLVAQFQCKCGTRFTKLPKYLWHSLKNTAKPKAKLQLRSCIASPV
ncbi:uncharacterized protein ACMZJ9_019268 isoform 2-T3 [Mantella aurantiaca]